MIRFTVYGTPQPQGSAKGFVLQRPGQKPRAIITSDNSKLKSWRQEVAKAAMLAVHNGEFDSCPIERKVPVNVLAVFYFTRPKSVNKNARKTTKPDGDKLLRAALDAMTGILYEDDAQVTDARVIKVFGSPERTEIAVGIGGTP